MTPEQRARVAVDAALGLNVDEQYRIVASAIAAAVDAEREACAQAAEEVAEVGYVFCMTLTQDDEHVPGTARWIAEKIRHRSQREARATEGSGS